ncbi:MAG: hypothetical protein RIS35_3170 [Pseudomonadota bacterium]|jgi:4-amino-4-deoxy-L-arabinose transferase-like glycosyltransferase
MDDRSELHPVTGSSRPVPAWLVWTLLALVGWLWFGTLGWRHLIHPDEGRYAELARGMLASGDWITPRLNGILYFEKPVLQYWATAAAFAVLGVGEAGARLWPALTGALTVGALWWSARQVLGARPALFGACVLGASVWWILNSHFVNLDTGLASFMTLTLLGFWIGQRDEATARENRNGMLVAWAGMALAVLSKGLVGIVLPGAVLVVYSVIARDLRVWRRMQWVPGIAILFAIAAPWFLLVSLRNPDFAHFFFIHEHFQRFTTTQHRRTGAWWYFVPVLAVGLLPWTTLLPGALAAGWKRAPGGFQAGRLFIAWAGVIFAFFSLSGSKLPSYILPVFPALALLIGPRLATLPARALRRHAIALTLLAGVAAAALLAAPHWFDRDTVEAADLAYRRWIVAGCAAFALGGAIATFVAAQAEGTPRTRARGGAPVAAVLALSLGSLVGGTLTMLGHQNFATLKSARTMVESIRDRIDPRAPFYSVATHDQTLPFYLGRPVTLVAWTDEFATGIRIEPQRQVPTIEAFEALWRARPGAVAMMRNERHSAFEAAGLPMRVLYRDAQRVVVVSP